MARAEAMAWKQLGRPQTPSPRWPGYSPLAGGEWERGALIDVAARTVDSPPAKGEYPTGGGGACTRWVPSCETPSDP